MFLNQKKKILMCFLFLFLFNLNYYEAKADQQQINQLSEQIENKKKELEKLDREIAEQKKLLSETSGQATNLQAKINALEANRKKILSEISATETQIKKAELTIDKLNLEISDKEILIKKHSEGIAESIRKINEIESRSLVERFLSSDNFSDFWSEFEQNINLQKTFKNEIDQLLDISQELKENQNQKLTEKEMLAKYKKELSGQAEAVASTKSEQQNILVKTKNQEAEYQKLLKEKESRKKAFEQEILDIESKIKILIDPNSYPTAKKGIFSWPLETIRVTQLFGGTQFAKNNPGIYGRPFHPGVDFGISIGSKVLSIGNGTVKGFGNTDAYPGCYAWGKWVLIEHDNGLSSLYAHLSSIMVTQGQTVSAGDLIAFSGNTGISTGPHLHLTIYASQGVKIGKYGDYKPGGSGCAATGATGPFADLDAYLDPMNYLPSL
jgi:murein DD-endopeptidase MepM/ murein hydrolase activator NlpD